MDRIPSIHPDYGYSYRAAEPKSYERLADMFIGGHADDSDVGMVEFESSYNSDDLAYAKKVSGLSVLAISKLTKVTYGTLRAVLERNVPITSSEVDRFIKKYIDQV